MADHHWRRVLFHLHGGIQMTQPERAQKRRRFWIARDEEFEECSPDECYFGDALQYHPKQGPLQWQASLIPVIEIRENETVIEKELLREMIDFIKSYRYFISQPKDFELMERLKSLDQT